MKPTLVVSFLGKDNALDHKEMTYYTDTLEQIADAGTTVLHIDTQWNNRWKLSDHDVFHTRGNLSFKCNTDGVRDIVSTWIWNDDRHRAPRSTEDILTDDFRDLLSSIHCEAERDWLARVAFPVV